MTTTGTPPKGKASGGKFGFLKDKRVLIGLAAAGGVGLVVFLKNGGGGTGAGGSGADDGNSGGSSMSPANYDSSSYDVGAQINDAFNGISDDLRGFTGTLTDIQTQLGKINGPASGTKPPAGGTTPPVKKPVPKKPVPKKSTAQYTYTTAFTTSSAARGSNWGSTLSSIAGHYHTSVSALLKLNPNIKNPNKIGAHQKIRVK